MISIAPVKAVGREAIFSEKKMEPIRIGTRFFIFSLILFSVAGGCTVTGHKMPPLASVEGTSRHFVMGQIIQVETGESLSFDRFIDQLETKDLVFIGEVHDNPEHHLIQVQILQALTARHGPLTVAMEFFQKPQQAIIDRYMAGESTESEFLKEVNWKKQWSFDYSFYRPLLLAVREHKGKILAINAPNDIVRKVARSGLNSLDSDERSLLAKDIDLGNEEHRAFLQDVYEQDAHSGLANFEYFYEAQCVWEDTMAENIAASLEGADETLVVLTGNGHIINKIGIPDRTAARIPADTATVLLSPMEDSLTIARNSADYVWLTGKYPRRSTFFHPKGHGKK
jgi:uncharacterized iron-regulated protein